MGFINKIIYFIILVLVLYVVLIFASPELADKLGSWLWLQNFNEKLREMKGGLDENATLDFDKENLENVTNKALDTVNGVKSSIDDFRSGVDSTIETYEEVKDQVEDVVETIDQTTQQIQEVKENFDNLKSNFEGTLDGENSENKARIQELKETYNNQ